MALEPHSRIETGHGWSARFLAAALLVVPVKQTVTYRASVEPA